MNVSIIGAGNMGHYLAIQLKSAGHDILQVFSRSPERGIQLAKSVDGTAVDDLSSLRSDANCYILAVPDTILNRVAAALPRFIKEKVLLLHCAGAVPVDVLNPFAELTGVLWPLFSIKKDRLPGTKNVPLFIEANKPEALTYLRELAESISQTVTVAEIEQRKRLHLAAVLSNNFVNHLMAVTQALLEEWKLPSEWLEPILMETVKNWKYQSAATDQTGPARRRDSGTMDAHLALLEDRLDWQELYRTLSASIQEFYKSE